MAWQVLIDFQDGEGQRDITNKVMVSSFKRTQAIWNELKPTANYCKFQMHRDAELINLLMTNEKETLISITKDSEDYFTGIVRPNVDGSVEALIGPTSIECVDYSERLKKKIRTTFAWANYYVCDNTTKTQSLVHQLIIKAGMTADDVDIADILKSVPYFINVASFEESTYWDALASILFEFGYVWYWDESGKFCVYNFIPDAATPTATFDNTNMSGTLKLSRRINKYEAFTIEYWNLATESGATVFKETSGGDDAHTCNIDVEDEHYYPDGSDTASVYLEYDYDGGEIVYVAGATADFELDGITQNLFTNYYKRAAIQLYNDTGSTATITKLSITGTVTYKKTLNKSKVEFIVNSENALKYEAKHLSAQADSDKLASGLLRYYRYSPVSYVLTSYDDVAMGTIVTLAETALGISQTCIVVKKDDVEVRTGLRRYTLEGIAAYSAETVAHESIIISVPPDVAPQDPTVVGVTATEIISGFTRGGGTMTPTTPTIAVCKATSTRAILLQWDRQLDLTNFDHYELQVSDDDTNWYALKFDGTDWKGAAAGHTDWYSEMLVHAGIPHGGTEDEPEGQTLYYRVRRVTKAADESSYSASASATENVVANGDLAADSITANKLLASDITTMLLRATGAVIIGYYGTGTVASPDEGDRRAYIDDDELGLEVYTNGAWSTERQIKLGGSDANGNFLPFLSCRGVLGNTDDAPGIASDPLPDATFYRFNFDDALTDQYGVNPWAVYGGTPGYTATPKWEGTKSYRATTASPARISWFTAGTIGDSFTIAHMVYIAGASGTTSVCGVYQSTGNNIIYLEIQGDALWLYWEKDGGDLHSVDLSASVSTTAWHFVGLIYDSVADSVYIRFDGNEYTVDISSESWGAGSWGPIIEAAPSGADASYIDDLIYSPAEAISPDLFFQHVNRNVPWTADLLAKDMALRAKTGGAVKAYLEAASAYLNIGAGIFDYDTVSNAYYAKFDNGLMVCYAQDTSTSTTSTAAGNIYRSAAVGFMFPEAFKSTAGLRIIPFAHSSGAVTWGAVVQSTLSASGVSIYVMGVQSAATGYAGYLAIGQWK